MSQPLVECVPNFSEGRDPKRIDAIVAAIRDVAGCNVLDVDPGFETNRTVVTFVGPPDAVAEGAFRAIAVSGELIDMRRHTGAHPRQGATDVCPFVPIAGVTMQDCVALARLVGRRVGEELGFPVFLYEHAATSPQRRSLAFVRQGEYEALQGKLAKPEWRPDFGPPTFVPHFGAIAIGAREFLVAYNINLNTRLKEHVNDIAFELREKGRAVRVGQTNGFYSSGTLLKYDAAAGIWPCGECLERLPNVVALASHWRTAHDKDFGAELDFFEQTLDKLDGKSVMKRGLFRHCRAVGWMIPEYGRAQVSINLTDFKTTSPQTVLDTVRDLASRRGLVVTGSEIVGMVPYEAVRGAGEHYLTMQGATRGLPVRDIVETAVQSLGLKDVGRFDIDKQVLGLPRFTGPLVAMKIDDFCDEVSRPSPAPGGGSVSALAGAIGAALAAMVANLSHDKPEHRAARGELETAAMRCQAVKDALLHAVDDDTSAFNGVLEAMRLPKGTPEAAATRRAAVDAAYKAATAVPLHTAELCRDALRWCLLAAEKGLAASITDAAVGGLMAHAGVQGAVLNARVNLAAIEDRDFCDEVQARCAALLVECEDLALALRRRLTP